MATEPNRTEPNRTEIIHDLENNFKQNNILKLKQLFPEVFCEDQIDFEKLKLVLGAENLAGAGERYQLDWAGKTAAYLNLQSPTSRTLVPCKEESANFDGTQNVFIEAENLEALKILQKAYAGSVKMIYIDPPYNTGSDSFIYPDKFSESREEYAHRVGDTDDAGYLKRDGVFQGAWRKNGKDSGHYHSNWLSMMLPRLHLAKTLLREDGVIFISIDDNEQAQLKLLCDEVFGAENFESIIWKKKGGAGNTEKILGCLTEYILCYFKKKEAGIFNYREIERTYKYKDEIGEYNLEGIEKTNSGAYARPTMLFGIEHPQTKEIFYPTDGMRWTIGKEKIYGKNGDDGLIAQNKLYFDDKKKKIYFIKRPEDYSQSENVYYNLLTECGSLSIAKDEISDLDLPREVFETPKPTALLNYLLNLITEKNSDSIILDFFSGSGTTAHAVMQLNAEDGGSRRFICVQLPEETEEKSEARKAGFNTIAEIAKERIRRAGRQVSDGLQDGTEIDTGFKVFKLAESGFKQWRQSGQADTEALQGELSLNIDSVLSGTPSENLLYELMLRLGLKLTCKVSLSDDVYFVEDEDTGGLYAFLLKRVDQGLIDAVLEKNPVKVVVLDRLFDGDDALKSNTVLQMKDAGVMFECV
ncbi:site-specific DNA-methyltransferase [Neisseria meningitidis]|uniref:site-specific DNA-methyltransferase n=1 Tax=Neisseria meningitidis TaxID=487 RepID=UPI000FCADFE7|nr:site-specific DNA-methyltransferase [Neisseria meningitidis]